MLMCFVDLSEWGALKSIFFLAELICLEQNTLHCLRGLMQH